MEKSGSRGEDQVEEVEGRIWRGVGGGGSVAPANHSHQIASLIDVEEGSCRNGVQAVVVVMVVVQV
ncbi:hypothetical protein E2C01_034468 [Portunus trituberculatus]|uniref:Uncharacterized protein n=1 Tax=Portunus trituberculatus TaxID=210409 RepID=A0A5B7F8L2_PORTR|nr:hypothetical protein [Portunus trituberculatus]